MRVGPGAGTATPGAAGRLSGAGTIRATGTTAWASASPRVRHSKSRTSKSAAGERDVIGEPPGTGAAAEGVPVIRVARR